MHRVLLIEDNPGDARLIEEMIREDPGTPFRLVHVDDDFGTGYSSLAYLKDLPIDTLKIDRSFVRDIGAGAEADEGVIAQAIISLGHALDLKVIAEGVETDAQLRFLRRHGCDEVQGFFYGEAVPPEAHARLLAKAKRKAGG